MTTPKLTLTELSELLTLRDATAIMRRLAARGPVLPPMAMLTWSAVAGGGEYSRPEIDHVKVDGIDCQLIIEIYRTAEERDREWIAALELFPATGADSAWLTAMRAALGLAFELSATEADGVEIYRRGSMEETICFPPNGITPPHLLLHMHPRLRTGA